MSRRNPVKPKRPSSLTIPKGVGPHVRLVFAEMQRQGITYDEAEWGSGVLRTTIKAWRTKTRPGLETIEAVLGLLGWTLTPVPTEKALGPDLVAALRPIADQFGLTMPEAISALTEVVASVHGRFPPKPAPAPAVASNVIPFKPRRRTAVPTNQTGLFDAA